jgi:hypothetical protein
MAPYNPSLSASSRAHARPHARGSANFDNFRARAKITSYGHLPASSREQTRRLPPHRTVRL